jgi:hypothetical protein
MNYLTPKEKLEIVLDLCEKHGITAYNIGGNTPLNASGVQRILKREVRPQSKTIDILYDYVIEKERESRHKESLKVLENINPVEDLETGYSNSIQEMVAREVYKRLEPLLSEIIQQQQQSNRILIKNSIQLERIKIDIDDLKTNIEEMNKVLSPKK